MNLSQQNKFVKHTLKIKGIQHFLLIQSFTHSIHSFLKYWANLIQCMFTYLHLCLGNHKCKHCGYHANTLNMDVMYNHASLWYHLWRNMYYKEFDICSCFYAAMDVSGYHALLFGANPSITILYRSQCLIEETIINKKHMLCGPAALSPLRFWAWLWAKYFCILVVKFSFIVMLVLIFIYLVILIKRDTPLERGSPMRVPVNAIVYDAIACAKSVPRSKNKPHDSSRLCVSEVIDLVVTSYILHFPLLMCLFWIE